MFFSDSLVSEISSISLKIVEYVIFGQFFNSLVFGELSHYV